MKFRVNDFARFGLLGAWLAANALLVTAQTPPPAAAVPVTAATEVKKTPFLKEIEAFEAADKKQVPPQNGILFIGSSSIRLWKNVGQDFPEFAVINRGFGGSQISDSIFYFDRIVLPYRPRMIVFFAGGNDLNAKKTPEQVAEDFKKFAAKVHETLPATRLAYISINPSVARWAQEANTVETNRLIEAYVKENDGKVGNLSFLDSHSKLLSAEGKPRPEILRTDGLHLNDDGYKLWLSILRPRILELAKDANVAAAPTKPGPPKTGDA